MSNRKGLVLEVGQAYLAGDFEKFEYRSSQLTGSKFELRLQLTNNTTIDVPSDKKELQNLLLILCEALPSTVNEYVQSRPQWFP